MGRNDVERSWRVMFWTEVEVSAPDSDAARAKAIEVVSTGNFDAGQMDIDDVVEVDPMTGCEVGA